MGGATNTSDEALLRAIALTCDNLASPNLCEIVDCRARAAANANRLTGHGYESKERYKDYRLSFANIANIHAMRDSHKQLSHLATIQISKTTASNAHANATSASAHAASCSNGAADRRASSGDESYDIFGESSACPSESGGQASSSDATTAAHGTTVWDHE